MEIILTPYTANTKRVDDESGLWAAIRKADVGWLGIKPFASNSIFAGDSKPGNPHEEADSRLARLTLRAILCNPAITAPIPGLITAAQVDNAALAVKERRQLDVEEKAELDRVMEHAYAHLPPHYEWPARLGIYLRMGLAPFGPPYRLATDWLPMGRMWRYTSATPAAIASSENRSAWRSSALARSAAQSNWP